MDTVTYPDHHVAHFIEEHFIPARVLTKDNPQLLKEYFVAWTPNIVITDEHGKVHYRVEGFLQPQDFVAKLSLGAGRYHLNRQEYDQAAERFEAVAERLSSKLLRKDDADLTLPPAPLNTTLERTFAAERHLIGRLPLPVGLSLFAVASAR